MLDTACLLQDEVGRLTGVILAGGKQEKPGGVHKALWTYQGERLVQRQIQLMQPICSEIILVTNEPRLFLPLVDSRVRIITDFYDGKGPLGGMHAAMTLAKHPHLWVVGCDMPFLSSDAALLSWKLIRKLDVDAVLPLLDGKLHPWHGVYNKRCASVLSFLLDRDKESIWSFLERVRFEPLTEANLETHGLNGHFIRQICTEDEYTHAKAIE
ncbi:molybdenum cofactor guanylyltransferase [Xylanibacillus composti]|uniref:Putative molybdenum cofactor guanylyltransferase n=1 Tax=Xylanibacillus composti TaxID=1572762 RepID=A0A8J4H4K1_9BACL|nr:molybdenum cofactor guanylyltransferase [Xylanibacillus composti]MDT9726964.1 molybdenum cofactor guanylyltransferase [Xylanibacillus composti]GIQ69520.1 putative molybdenum cofactor guanylyltransferase [Xylanibacillus composti]